MGQIKEQIIEVIEMLKSDRFTVSQIADFTGMDEDDVFAIADTYLGDDIDDSMDGDFDSAMASAGFGTDEDYGYFGD